MKSTAVLTYLVTLSAAIGLCLCVEPNVGFIHSWRSDADREVTHLFDENEVTTIVEVDKGDDGKWNICANNRLAFPVNFILTVDGQRVKGPRVESCRTPSMIPQYSAPVRVARTDTKPQHVSFKFYLRKSAAVEVKQMDRLPSFSRQEYQLRPPRPSDEHFDHPFVYV
jgi:hypothetical protein